jgi:hypothetical protein
MRETQSAYADVPNGHQHSYDKDLPYRIASVISGFDHRHASSSLTIPNNTLQIIGEIRWDEKAGLRRDAVPSHVIDVLKAQEIKETGNEEG